MKINLDDNMVFNRDGMQGSYQTLEDELRVMGQIMFESVGEKSPELESVTFETEDGQDAHGAKREEWQQ